MTRLDQALRWWKNHADEEDGTVQASWIPDRHLEVLRKARKLVVTRDTAFTYRLKDPNE